MLKAEKLSDYFINMSKKVKIESQDKKDMKYIIKADQSMNSFDKFKSLYTQNKDLNQSSVAEILGVSRQTINKYIKKIENADHNQ
jgi:DNA-binding XRE family transcriptional regulator